jgi:hypothetical protein
MRELCEMTERNKHVTSLHYCEQSFFCCLVNRSAFVLEIEGDTANETCSYTVIGMHHAHAHEVIADQIVVNFVFRSLYWRMCRFLSYGAGQEPKSCHWGLF